MLFISPEFIFGYLPVVFVGYFIIAGFSRPAGILWLTLASLYFYGSWNSQYVGLLLGSISANFALGWLVARLPRRGWAKAVLAFGVGANLALLGYYKYTNFLIGAFNSLGADWTTAQIVLPLGISFFTFTQIAFLVDAYRGEAREFNPVHYGLFVTYFPHLIAGPILHHKQMMPQFAKPDVGRIRLENVTVGLTIFVIGLFKKLVLADELAPYAASVFEAAGAGTQFGAGEAWIGALAYTFQLYFDFSGYCDMAIGLSRLFGIQLPVNFDSPYKSLSIIEFWRRWHITLSTFLRDYLYIPLGGNRHGPVRRYGNLLATMLLGGLWHGAGWTFIIWGGLHGLYLVVNHMWRHFCRRAGLQTTGPAWVIAAWIVTFLSVVVAWVYFRAPDIGSAHTILQRMFGLSGLLQTASSETGAVIQAPASALRLIAAALFIAVALPNTQQFMALFPLDRDPRRPDQAARWWNWRPVSGWGLYVGAMGAASLFVALGSVGKVREFLYFQF